MRVLLAFVLLIGAAALGIRSARAPSLPDAAPGAFDIERAMATLARIAAEPRPPGTAAHTAVRDHLVSSLRASGFETEIQDTSFLYAERGNPFPAGRVQNVIGRLEGADGRDGVLVVAHYDSVPSSPGASDDGAAVAALLEAARLLGEGPKPNNDVIFLLSDAEEAGMLGARAFATQHPLMKKVRVLLNFEARGSRGPTSMFETGPANGWLIDTLARSTSRPVASSLYVEIYRRMQNDTDFSAFREADLAGLNFAYIEGLPHYHTSLDDVAHIDPRSLAHHGQILMGLLGSLKDAPLGERHAGDKVYFNLGPLFVRYSTALAWPLTLGSVLLFAGAAQGLARARAARRGLLYGLLWLCALPLAAALAAALLQVGVGALHPTWQGMPQGETYNSPLYLGAYEGMLFGLWSLSLSALRRRAALSELTAGALCGLCLLALASLVWMPGASYLPTLPLLFGALGLIELQRAEGPRLGVLALLAVPPVVLLVPLIWALHVSLTLSLSAVVIFWSALWLPALPALGVMAESVRALPALCSALCVALLLAGSATSRFDREHPIPAGATYVLDVDRGTALLATSQSGELARLSLGSEATARSEEHKEYFPTWNLLSVADAQILPLPPPEIELLAEELRGERRVLSLRIRSLRQAPLVELQIPYDAGLAALSIGDQRLDADALRLQGYGSDRIVVQYWGAPADGLMVSFELPAGRQLPLRVSDTTFERKDSQSNVISMPIGFGLPDAVLVTRAHTY